MAQVVATVVAAIGIGVSMWIGVRTLREVQKDRALRHRPYLAFECGGRRLSVSFDQKGASLPGVNPAYAKDVLGHLPEDELSVLLAKRTDDTGAQAPTFYGKLKNFGSGAALATHATYVAEEVWIGEERFAIDATKRTEPLYDHPLNRLPSVPSHIEPGQQGELTRLPAFIVKDYDRKISRVEGYFLIECRDIFGELHPARQRFHLFTAYGHQPPAVHVTFAEMVEPAGAPSLSRRA